MKCDHCKNDFFLSPKEIIEETISKEDDIREQYFVCPNCNFHYSIIITDGEMRKIIEKRKAIKTIIKTKYKGSNNEKQIRKLMSEDNECKEFLDKRFEELKSKYLNKSI